MGLTIKYRADKQSEIHNRPCLIFASTVNPFNDNVDIKDICSSLCKLNLFATDILTFLFNSLSNLSLGLALFWRSVTT